MSQQKNPAATPRLSRVYTVAKGVFFVRGTGRSLYIVGPQKRQVIKVTGLASEILPHLKPKIRVWDILRIVAPQSLGDSAFMAEADAFISELVRLKLIRLAPRSSRS